MSKLRMAAALAAALLCSALLGGCMQSRELKQRTIIQAVGVDKKEELFVLTMQRFLPDPSGGSAAGAGGDQNTLVQVSAPTVGEAVDKVTHYHGSEVFLGTSSYVVIGRRAAQEDLEAILSYFNSHHEITPELNIVMAQRSAEEIIQAQVQKEENTSLQVENILTQHGKSGLAGQAMLRNVMNRLESAKSDPYLPILTTVQSPQGEELVKLAGMAVFREGRLKDQLNLQQARGALWAMDEIQSAVMSVEFGPQSRATVDLTRSRSTLRTSIQDGAPVFALTIRCEGGVEEVVLPQGGGAGVPQLEEIQTALEKKIENEVQNAVRKVFFQDRSDIFRYSEFLKKYHPDFWKKNQQRWEELIGESRFTCQVQCRLDRPGLEAEH